MPFIVGFDFNTLIAAIPSSLSELRSKITIAGGSSTIFSNWSSDLTDSTSRAAF
jgi:hypothetical protein